MPKAVEHALVDTAVDDDGDIDILLAGNGDTLLGRSDGAAHGSLLPLVLASSMLPDPDPQGSLPARGGEEEWKARGEALEGGTPTAPMPPQGSGMVEVVIPPQGSPLAALAPWVRSQ